VSRAGSYHGKLALKPQPKPPIQVCASAAFS
jgi:hypothetical protein